MNAKELVRGIIENYGSEIKPMIESGFYDAAKSSLGNFIYVLHDDYLNVCTEVHSGMSFIASLENLERMLDRKDKNSIDKAVEWFETSFTQTRLLLKKELKSNGDTS